MFKKFSHVMFYCKDPRVTQKWYEEKLNFKIQYSSEYYGVSTLESIGLKFDFHATSGEDKFDRCYPPLPYLEVDDIDQAVAKLSELGISCDEVTREDGIPAHISFQDCDGNWLGLIEY